MSGLKGLCVKDFIWSGVSELRVKDFGRLVFCFLPVCGRDNVGAGSELVIPDVVVGNSPKRQSCVIRRLGLFIHVRFPRI